MKNILRCLYLILALFVVILSMIHHFVGWWAEAATKWAVFVNLIKRFTGCISRKLDSVKHSIKCSIEDDTAFDTTFEEEVKQLLLWKALLSDAFQFSILEQLAAVPLGTTRLGGSCEPFMLTAAPAPLGAIAPAKDSPLGDDLLFSTNNSVSIDIGYIHHDGCIHSLPVLIDKPRLLRLPQVGYPLGDVGILGWLQNQSQLEKSQQLVIESMSLDITQCGSLEPLTLAEAPAPLDAIAPVKESPLGDNLPKRPAKRTASELRGMTNPELRKVIKDEIAPWAGSLALPNTKANKAKLRQFIADFYKSQKASLG